MDYRYVYYRDFIGWTFLLVLYINLLVVQDVECVVSCVYKKRKSGNFVFFLFFYARGS